MADSSSARDRVVEEPKGTGQQPTGVAVLVVAAAVVLAIAAVVVFLR